MTATLKKTDTGIFVPMELFKQIISTSSFSVTFSNTSATLQEKTLEEELSFAYERAKNSDEKDFVNL